MATKVAMNPLSPSPWTVGGRRSTDERTPIPRKDSASSAVACRIPAGFGRISSLGTSPSFSVATRPAVRPSMPEASTKGRSDAGQGGAHGLDGPPVGGTGGGEVAAEGDLVLEGQVDDAVGIGRRLGQAVGIVEVATEHGGAGRFERAAADASERARPTTWWPAPSNSGTMADPIQPDAPVTKIFMGAPPDT